MDCDTGNGRINAATGPSSALFEYNDGDLIDMLEKTSTSLRSWFLPVTEQQYSLMDARLGIRSLPLNGWVRHDFKYQPRNHQNVGPHSDNSSSVRLRVHCWRKYSESSVLSMSDRDPLIQFFGSVADDRQTNYSRSSNRPPIILSMEPIPRH